MAGAASPPFFGAILFSGLGNSVPSYRLLQFLSSGTGRRDGVKDPAQSTTLVDNLDDVVRSTGLWTKLYAR